MNDLPAGSIIIWYSLAFAFGIFAGLARYVIILKNEPNSAWTWKTLGNELVISTFVGVMVFIGAILYLDDRPLAALFWAGICSHFGARLIAVGESFLSKQTDYYLGFKLPKLSKQKRDRDNDSNETGQ